MLTLTMTVSKKNRFECDIDALSLLRRETRLDPATRPP
jgi:hypothetical protein